MELPRADGWVRSGDKAPSFELPDRNFKPVSPLGTTSKVVLSFFPAAFSGSLDGGCECQMRTLNQELSDIGGHDDVAVYGIGRELPFTMSAWSDKMSLDFPLLCDATLVVAQAFVGVCDVGRMLANRSGIPSMTGYLSPNRGVVVIVKGTVVYKWVGKNADTGKPDPSILPDIASVRRALAGERARL
ncbi:unnamed protein product [Scytosiphon promiscuus]